VLIQTGRVGWTAISLLALLAAGCGEQAPTSPVVSVRNIAFNPTSVTVPVGGKVIWSFEDGQIAHTVTADANGFGSAPNGTTSGTFEHTFGQAGTYAYHCDFHPLMKGTVTVR
jgi:plastocyanin